MEAEILKKIYQYCAYQDRSTGEVRKKLSEWEVSGEDQDKIITHLEAEKFLNEERYVRSFVRGKFSHKNWGRNKIRHELRLKKISPALIQKVINEEIDPETYEKTIQKLTEQKRHQHRADSPEKQKEKIFRFLLQKGFEGDIIHLTLETHDF
ncbi:MAG: regulatory protein RecX [Bacteroidia bacterium]|nr:regulatory protein RecX [Bacteroidia bacterium]